MSNPKTQADSIRKDLRELRVNATVSAAKPSEADSIRASLSAFGIHAQVTDK